MLHAFIKIIFCESSSSKRGIKFYEITVMSKRRYNDKIQKKVSEPISEILIIPKVIKGNAHIYHGK